MNEQRRTVRIRSWLKAEGLTSSDLEAAAGICRQTMTQIKNGRDVRQSTMARILRAARRLAQRRVAIEELFDFDND